MATIPYLNQPQEKLKPLNAPGFRNTATVENLAKGEVELAKQFGVAADKLQDYVIAKQNQLDLTRVQNASSAWKEYEFQRRRYILNKHGSNAEGALTSETETWDRYRDKVTPEEIGGKPDLFQDERNVGGILESDFTENPGYTPPTPEDVKYRSNLAKLKTRFDGIYEKMDERQKIAIDEIIKNRRPAYLHAIGTHEDNERIKAMVKANEEGIKWAATEAINSTTPEERDKKIHEGETMIRANMKALGQDKEAKDVNIQLQVFRSSIHNGVIEDMLNRPDNQTHHLEEADKYFKEHKDELNLKTRKALNNRLYDHRVIVKSNQLALEISQKPDEEQFTALSGIKDDAIREKTMSKLFQLQGMSRRSKAAQEKENINIVYEWLQDNKGMKDGKPIDLNAITAETGFVSALREKGDPKRNWQTVQNAWKNLDAGSKESLQKILKGLIEGDQPVPENTDLQTADKVMRMVTENKKEFLDTNLAVKYYGQMKPERISSFMTLQRTMREEDAKGDGENSVVSWTQQITARMNKLGWTGDDYARHRGRTQQRLMEKIIEHRVNSNTDPAKRTNPTDDEIKGFIKDIVNVSYVTETNKKYPIAPDEKTDEFKNEKRITAFIQSKGWTTKKDLKKIGAFKEGIIKATDKWMANHPRKNPDEFDMAKIIRTVGEDEVFVEQGMLGLDWLDPDDGILYSEAQVDPKKYPEEKLYVVLDNNEKVKLSDLTAMPKEESRAIGNWLENNGFPGTYKNVAQRWRELHPNARLEKAVFRGKADPIPNPNGTQTTTAENLEAAVMDAEGNDKTLQDLRLGVGTKYGPTAVAVFDQLVKENRE